MRIRKETGCFIDPNPTRVDYPILDLSAPPSSPGSALPSVTDVELAALRGVDLAEIAAEPVNRFNIARAGIKLAAWVARKLR